jgi:4-oxalmesaconate hydratase
MRIVAGRFLRLKGFLNISDNEIVAWLYGNIRQMKQRGIDRLRFSPRASGMGHEFGSEMMSRNGRRSIPT